MWTRHDLVVELRSQEAIEASGTIGDAAGRKRGFDEFAPVAVDNGKIAQGFTGRKREGSAKFVDAKFQPQILRFATADGAFGFVRHREKTAAFFIFVDGAIEKIRQGLRHLCFAEIRDGFRFRNCGRFLEAASRNAVFDVRFRSGKKGKGALEDVAAVKWKVWPAIGECRNGTDRLNVFLLALQPDDAECRAHARNFRDEQFGHGTAPSFFRRGFAGFVCAETRCRISTSCPWPRQYPATRSATRRRWHFSGPASEHSSTHLEDQIEVSSVCGTPRSFMSWRKRVS